MFQSLTKREMRQTIGFVLHVGLACGAGWTVAFLVWVQTVSPKNSYALAGAAWSASLATMLGFVAVPFRRQPRQMLSLAGAVLAAFFFGWIAAGLIAYPYQTNDLWDRTIVAFPPTWSSVSVFVTVSAIAAGGRHTKPV